MMRIVLALLALLLGGIAQAQVINNGGSAYTAAANSCLTLTGNAFSLGDGVGCSYTSPGQLSLIGGTITTSTKALNITQTWNNSGTTFDAPIFVNITNTASSTSSKLIDLQLGSQSALYYVIGGALSGNGLNQLFLGVGPGITVDPYISGYSVGGLHGLIMGSDNFNSFVASGIAGLVIKTNLGICWNSEGFNTGINCDVTLTRLAAATIHFGAADASAAVPQTLGFQGILAGNSNTNGANATIIGSLSTGSGVSGDMIFQTGFGGVSATSTVTISNASPAVISWTSHGLSVNQPMTFTTTGALPTGLTAGTAYYVISAGFGANSFEVSTTVGGSAINTSSAGSGVQTAATATAQEPPITAMTIKGATQQVNFAQPFQTTSSTTGAGTATFTNSPCSGLTTEQWVPIKINGQSGTWYVPACQ